MDTNYSKRHSVRKCDHFVGRFAFFLGWSCCVSTSSKYVISSTPHPPPFGRSGRRSRLRRRGRLRHKAALPPGVPSRVRRPPPRALSEIVLRRRNWLSHTALSYWYGMLLSGVHPPSLARPSLGRSLRSKLANEVRWAWGFPRPRKFSRIPDAART